MPVDIDEGDAATANIEGAACYYVLTVAVGRELEMSIYVNDKADLCELRVALEEALREKQATILVRADTPMGAVEGWQALDPGVFVKRLPRP
ncbi:MAG: hypothetical protein ABSA15_04165 [Thermoplasmata archaeon]